MTNINTKEVYGIDTLLNIISDDTIIFTDNDNVNIVIKRNGEFDIREFRYLFLTYLKKDHIFFGCYQVRILYYRYLQSFRFYPVLNNFK